MIGLWPHSLIVVWVSQPVMKVLCLLRYHLRIAIGVDRHICGVRRKDPSITIIAVNGASIHQRRFVWLVWVVLSCLETSAHGKSGGGELFHCGRSDHERIQTCQLLNLYKLRLCLTDCFLSKNPLTAVLFKNLFCWTGLLTLNSVPLGLIRLGLSEVVNW